MALRLTLGMALIVLALTEPATADRRPTDRERAKIEAAFDRVGFNCDAFPASSCSRRIRVSTVNERWAAGYIRAHGAQATAASVRRKNHRWRVHQVGNGGGCDMPERVRKDLDLECY